MNEQHAHIQSLDFGPHKYPSIHNLVDAGYDTLEKIAALDDAVILKYRGVGKVALMRLKELAKKRGVEWTGKTSGPRPFGPVLKLDHNSGHMNLRDWFAGQALASFGTDYFPMEAAEKAYRYADAMLAERMKEPRPQPEEPKLNYVN